MARPAAAHGQAPFHLTLDSVLSASAMRTIAHAGRMVFHAVGDTGGVNTPTQIENVAAHMSRTSRAVTHPSIRRSSITSAMWCITTEKSITISQSFMNRT